MKSYTTPEVTIIEVAMDDIITASPGTETPITEGGNGIWDLEF